MPGGQAARHGGPRPWRARGDGTGAAPELPHVRSPARPVRRPHRWAAGGDRRFEASQTCTRSGPGSVGHGDATPEDFGSGLAGPAGAGSDDTGTSDAGPGDNRPGAAGSPAAALGYSGTGCRGFGYSGSGNAGVRGGRPDDAGSGDARSGVADSGTARSDETVLGPAGPAGPDKASRGSAGPDSARSGEAAFSDARLGGAGPRDAGSGDNRAGDARSRGACPEDVRSGCVESRDSRSRGAWAGGGGAGDTGAGVAPLAAACGRPDLPACGTRRRPSAGVGSHPDRPRGHTVPTAAAGTRAAGPAADGRVALAFQVGYAQAEQGNRPGVAEIRGGEHPGPGALDIGPGTSVLVDVPGPYRVPVPARLACGVRLVAVLVMPSRGRHRSPPPPPPVVGRTGYRHRHQHRPESSARRGDPKSTDPGHHDHGMRRPLRIRVPSTRDSYKLDPNLQAHPISPLTAVNNPPTDTQYAGRNPRAGSRRACPFALALTRGG